MKIKKYLYATVLIIILVLFSYWLKNQYRISLSKSLSLSKYIPFKYLKKNNIMKSSQKGELINESFESTWLPDNWSKLWMKEKGKVTQGFDSRGANDSQCLLIKSTSSKSWSYAHLILIQVKSGDNFSFEGLVKKDGKAATAYLGVATYDINKKVIKWSYVRKKVDKNNAWVKVTKRFKISDGIEYIRFILTGSGIGEFRFDNIKLIKE